MREAAAARKQALETNPFVLALARLQMEKRIPSSSATGLRIFMQGAPGKVSATTALNKVRELQPGAEDEFRHLLKVFIERSVLFQTMVSMIVESDLFHRPRQGKESYYDEGMAFIMAQVLTECNVGKKLQPLFARFFGPFSGDSDIRALELIIQSMGIEKSRGLFSSIKEKSIELQQHFNAYYASVFSESNYDSNSHDMFSNPLAKLTIVSEAAESFLSDPRDQEILKDATSPEQHHELELLALELLKGKAPVH